MSARRFWSYYNYTIVTLALFAVALIGQWMFGWYAYIDEQQAHGQAVEFSSYVNQLMRDTLENWQSEFLQLVWQVAGLSFLLHVGSPQSKEGSERLEAKIDELLRNTNKKDADEVIQRLDRQFRR